MKYIHNNWQTDCENSWVLCDSLEEVSSFINYIKTLDGRTLHLVSLSGCEHLKDDHNTYEYRYVISSAIETNIVKRFFDLMED